MEGASESSVFQLEYGDVWRFGLVGYEGGGYSQHAVPNNLHPQELRADWNWGLHGDDHPNEVGGVAVYLNGNRLARFNLEEGYNAFTESISVHNATVFSKFHVILSTTSVVNERNCLWDSWIFLFGLHWLLSDKRAYIAPLSTIQMTVAVSTSKHFDIDRYH